MIVTLKNVARSPRGIYTLAGYVQFEPGEEREVDISEAEHGSLASYFQAAGARLPQLDRDNDGHPGGSLPAAERRLDDLRAQYEELFGNAPDGRWGEKRLNDEINRKLAE